MAGVLEDRVLAINNLAASAGENDRGKNVRGAKAEFT